MSIPSLEALLARFQALGAQRVLCKRLAENDNSKQQVYLGHGFDAVGLFDSEGVQASDDGCAVCKRGDGGEGHCGVGHVGEVGEDW